MAERKRKYQGYSMSDKAVRLVDYVANKTMVAKSRLVEKAVMEYYENYLKELEASNE